MGRAGNSGREEGCRFLNMWHREVGVLAPRVFSRRAAASLDLVLRLRIHRKLVKHRGGVNTVSFNANGDILVSGSNDKMVILWDWESGLVKQAFHSGHEYKVLQARFLACTDGRTIVTCADDGEVRLAQLQDGGHVTTSMMGRHEGRARKIAIEPGNSHIFYSCGDDAHVYLFDSRAKTVTKLIKCSAIRQRALYIPYVSLRAIAIDPMNTNHFAAAGSDEFARVYDIRKCRLNENLYCNLVNCFCPPHLIRDREACITGLAFSGQSELMVSYKLEHIYLFSKDGGLGPKPFASPVVKEIHAEDGTPSFIFTKHSKVAVALEFYTAHCRCNTVQGASFFGPNCEYVTSGSHCGHVFIWRKKGGELLRVMDGGKGRVNCVEPHPSATILASSGTGKDIKVWIPNAEEPAVPEIDEAIGCHGKSCSETDEDADNLDDDDTNDSLDSDD